VTCYPELSPAARARLDAEYVAAICAAADAIPATTRARRYAAKVAAVRAH
jgi:hypothetical protein